MLVVAYLGVTLGLRPYTRFLAEAGLRRANYAGREIPLGAGLLLVLVLPGLLALAFLAGVPALPVRLSLVFLYGVTGFGLAGLVDDCLGTAVHKGFRGHFTALFREGRLTSGILKALSGAAVSLFAGLALAASYPGIFGAWYQILLNTLLLAFAANLINLFDLRPGRAGKIFLLGVIVCAGLAKDLDRFAGPVLLVAVAALPLIRRDLRAELMLGDTGANFLGATLGMAMIFWLTLHAKIAAAVILLFLQVASERYSFSALIDRVGILRWLDRWGRGAEP